MLRFVFITATQKILRVLLKPIFYIFFDISIFGEESLKGIKRPIIVVMNHKSSLDAFLFGVCVPVRSEIWPLRYMISRGSFKTPTLRVLDSFGILKVITFVFGHFPVKNGVGLKENLQLPFEALKKKEGSVAIFIEGERVFEEGLGEVKRGAAVLSMRSGVGILPIIIKNSFNLKPKDIFLRRKIKIIIGKKFTLNKTINENDSRYLKEREFIKNKLKELYNQDENIFFNKRRYNRSACEASIKD